MLNRHCKFALRRVACIVGVWFATTWFARGGTVETPRVILPPLNFTNVVPGLDYAHVRETNRPWSIHVARLDRRQRDLGIVTTLAQGRVQGLASLSRQTSDFPSRRGQPLLAINGDFFDIIPGPYQGDPGGLQILEGELVSAPTDKCFWIGADGEPHIDVVYSGFEVTWPGRHKSPLGLNQPPLTNAATLFTPAFGDSTRATNCTELVLERAGRSRWLPLQVSENYRARIREIHPEGNTALTAETMVLTLTGTATTNLTSLRPGDTVAFTTATTVDLAPVKEAIGGGPVLIKDGVVQPWPSRKGIFDYLQPRHPRTVIGYNERFIYFVVVDGRQNALSIGMSFVELSALVKVIGCTQALNLDGGGSTTFWLNGQVVNSPSDKRERPLANGVLVVMTQHHASRTK